MTLRGARILLASGSPRRRQLLEAEGATVLVAAPSIDDSGAELAAADPSRLVTALAWFKAAQVLASEPAAPHREASDWLVAADTICVVDGRVLGKPSSEADAQRMIESMLRRAHEVFTGVCVIELPRGGRRLFAERAVVEIGDLDASVLAAHLRTEAWRGRAGGYNFAEVRDAGWPIRCEGDPTTVMGLPMSALGKVLDSRRSTERAGR